VGVAFDAGGNVAGFLELLLNFIRNGLILPGVIAAADNQRVGEGGDVAQIQYLDVFGLFGVCGANCGEPERVGLGDDGLCSELFRSCQIEEFSCPYCTISLMSNFKVLISAEQIHKRVQEMGAEIDRDFPGGEPVYLIGVLKGACIFLADLARAIQSPARIEFIGISSYGKGQTSSGQVQLTKDLDVPIEGHNVILVEDILDTGITLTYLAKLMAQRKPKSLRIATLLDKPERRKSEVHADYVGFKIPDEFVVGYGLDYAEDYRNLKDVCVMTA
jgi:hypoxanthine phosphoribosyltransferase